MENNLNSITKFTRNINKLFNKIKVFSISVKDEEFNLFKKTEYRTIEMSEVNDIKRLNYIKNLQLASQGYVTSNIKSLISEQKTKNRLLNKNQDITVIGSIEINDKEKKLSKILIGINNKTNTIKITTRSIDNIPIWKNIEKKQLRAHLNKLYPSEESLTFKTNLFLRDIKDVKGIDKKMLVNQFNDIVEFSNSSNKYFSNHIVETPEDLFKNKSKYINKNISVNNIKYTVNEVSDNYVIVEPLLIKNIKNNKKIINKREYFKIYNDNKIQQISSLKFNLKIGFNKGSLMIGKSSIVNGSISTKWQSFNDFNNDDDISKRNKIYINNEIILKRNYLLEDSNITLKFNDQAILIKEHANTKDLYFQIQKPNVPLKEPEKLNFQTHEFIINNAKNNENLKKYLDKFNQNQNINTVIKTL